MSLIIGQLAIKAEWWDAPFDDDWLGARGFWAKILAGDLNEKKNQAGDVAKIKIRIEIMQFQGSGSRLGLSRIGLSPARFFFSFKSPTRIFGSKSPCPRSITIPSPIGQASDGDESNKTCILTKNIFFKKFTKDICAFKSLIAQCSMSRRFIT